MDLNMSALLILGLIGLFLLGAIVVVGLLLASKSTRTVGVMILTLGLGVVAIGGFAMLTGYMVLVPSKYEEAATVQEFPLESRPVDNIHLSASGSQSSNVEAVSESPSDTPPDAGAEDKRGSSSVDVFSSVAGLSGSSGPTADGATEPDLPAWANLPPRRKGDVYQMSVTIGPYTSPLECDAHKDKVLGEAVREYIELTFGRDAAEAVSLPPDFAQRNLVKEEFEEHVQASFGPMVQLHVLLEFDANDKQQIEKAWHAAQASERLQFAAIGLVVVMLLLAAIYGYLKFSSSEENEDRVEPVVREKSGRGLRWVWVSLAIVLVIFVLLSALRWQESVELREREGWRSGYSEAE